MLVSPARPYLAYTYYKLWPGRAIYPAKLALSAFRSAHAGLLNQRYLYGLFVLVGAGVFVGGVYSTERTFKSEKVTVTGVSPAA